MSHSGEFEPEEGWSCEICTFMNPTPITAPSCELCGSDNPIAAALRAEAEEAAMEAGAGAGAPAASSGAQVQSVGGPASAHEARVAAGMALDNHEGSHDSDYPDDDMPNTVGESSASSGAAAPAAASPKPTISPAPAQIHAASSSSAPAPAPAPAAPASGASSSSSAAAAAPSGWECSVCTLINPGPARRCTLCGVGERPADFGGATAPGAAAGVAGGSGGLTSRSGVGAAASGGGAGAGSGRTGDAYGDGDDDDDMMDHGMGAGAGLASSSSNAASGTGVFDPASIDRSGHAGFPAANTSKWFTDWEPWSVDNNDDDGSDHTGGKASTGESSSTTATMPAASLAAAAATISRSEWQSYIHFLLPSLLNLAAQSSSYDSAASPMSPEQPSSFAPYGAFGLPSSRAALRLTFECVARSSRTTAGGSGQDNSGSDGVTALCRHMLLDHADALARVCGGALASEVVTDVYAAAYLLNLCFNSKQNSGTTSVDHRVTTLAHGLRAHGGLSTLLSLVLLSGHNSNTGLSSSMRQGPLSVMLHSLADDVIASLTASEATHEVVAATAPEPAGLDERAWSTIAAAIATGVVIPPKVSVDTRTRQTLRLSVSPGLRALRTAAVAIESALSKRQGHGAGAETEVSRAVVEAFALVLSGAGEADGSTSAASSPSLAASTFTPFEVRASGITSAIAAFLDVDRNASCDSARRRGATVDAASRMTALLQALSNSSSPGSRMRVESLVNGLHASLAQASRTIVRGDLAPSSSLDRDSDHCDGDPAVLVARALCSFAVSDDGSADGDIAMEEARVEFGSSMFQAASRRLAWVRVMSLAAKLIRTSPAPSLHSEPHRQNQSAHEGWDHLIGGTRCKGEAVISGSALQRAVEMVLSDNGSGTQAVASASTAGASSGVNAARDDASTPREQDALLGILSRLSLLPASALASTIVYPNGKAGAGLEGIIDVPVITGGAGADDGARVSLAVDDNRSGVRSRVPPSFGRVLSLLMKQSLPVRLVPNHCDPALQLLGLAPMSIVPVDAGKEPVAEHEAPPRPVRRFSLNDIDDDDDDEEAGDGGAGTGKGAGSVTFDVSTSASRVQSGLLTAGSSSAAPSVSKVGGLLVSSDGRVVIGGSNQSSGASGSSSTSSSSSSLLPAFQLLASSIPVAAWCDPLSTLYDLHSHLLPQAQRDLRTLRSNIVTAAYQCHAEVERLRKEIDAAAQKEAASKDAGAASGTAGGSGSAAAASSTAMDVDDGGAAPPPAAAVGAAAGHGEKHRRHRPGKQARRAHKKALAVAAGAGTGTAGSEARAAHDTSKPNASSGLAAESQSAPVSAAVNSVALCRFFNRAGGCRRGDRCKFAHIRSGTGAIAGSASGAAGHGASGADGASAMVVDDDGAAATAVAAEASTPAAGSAPAASNVAPAKTTGKRRKRGHAKAGATSAPGAAAASHAGSSATAVPAPPSSTTSEGVRSNASTSISTAVGRANKKAAVAPSVPSAATGAGMADGAAATSTAGATSSANPAGSGGAEPASGKHKKHRHRHKKSGGEHASTKAGAAPSVAAPAAVPSAAPPASASASASSHPPTGTASSTSAAAAPAPSSHAPATASSSSAPSLVMMCPACPPLPPSLMRQLSGSTNVASGLGGSTAAIDVTPGSAAAAILNQLVSEGHAFTDQNLFIRHLNEAHGFPSSMARDLVASMSGPAVGSSSGAATGAVASAPLSTSASAAVIGGGAAGDGGMMSSLLSRLETMSSRFGLSVSSLLGGSSGGAGGGGGGAGGTSNDTASDLNTLLAMMSPGSAAAALRQQQQQSQRPAAPPAPPDIATLMSQEMTLEDCAGDYGVFDKSSFVDNYRQMRHHRSSAAGTASSNPVLDHYVPDFTDPLRRILDHGDDGDAYTGGRASSATVALRSDESVIKPHDTVTSAMVKRAPGAAVLPYADSAARRVKDASTETAATSKDRRSMAGSASSSSSASHSGMTQQDQALFGIGVGGTGTSTGSAAAPAPGATPVLGSAAAYFTDQPSQAASSVVSSSSSTSSTTNVMAPWVRLKSGKPVSIRRLGDRHASMERASLLDGLKRLAEKDGDSISSGSVFSDAAASATGAGRTGSSSPPLLYPDGFPRGPAPAGTQLPPLPGQQPRPTAAAGGTVTASAYAGRPGSVPDPSLPPQARPQGSASEAERMRMLLAAEQEQQLQAQREQWELAMQAQAQRAEMDAEHEHHNHHHDDEYLDDDDVDGDEDMDDYQDRDDQEEDVANLAARTAATSSNNIMFSTLTSAASPVGSGGGGEFGLPPSTSAGMPAPVAGKPALPPTASRSAGAGGSGAAHPMGHSRSSRRRYQKHRRQQEQQQQGAAAAAPTTAAAANAAASTPNPAISSGEPSPSAKERLEQQHAHLVTLYQLHEACKHVAIRGIWFAVHSTGHSYGSSPAESSTVAVCVWGPALAEYSLFERLGCVLTSGPEQLGSAVRRLLHVQDDTPESVGTGSSGCPIDPATPYTITWGTLGPHPHQRPPSFVRSVIEVGADSGPVMSSSSNNFAMEMDKSSSMIPLFGDPGITSHVNPLSVMPGGALALGGPGAANIVAVSATRDQRGFLAGGSAGDAPSLEQSAPALVPHSALFPGSPSSRKMLDAVHTALGAASAARVAGLQSMSPYSAIALPAVVLRCLADESASWLVDQQQQLSTSQSDALQLVAHTAGRHNAVITAALRSILTDPVAVIAHTAALSSSRGVPSWPFLTRLLTAHPHLVPLSLRVAYLEQCGFGLLRSLVEFERRLEARAVAAVAADAAPAAPIAPASFSNVPDGDRSTTAAMRLAEGRQAAAALLSHSWATGEGTSTTSAAATAAGAAGGAAAGGSGSAASKGSDVRNFNVPIGEEGIPQSASEYGVHVEKRRARVRRDRIVESGIFIMGPRIQVPATPSSYSAPSAARYASSPSALASSLSGSTPVFASPEAVVERACAALAAAVAAQQPQQQLPRQQSSSSSAGASGSSASASPASPPAAASSLASSPRPAAASPPAASASPGIGSSTGSSAGGAAGAFGGFSLSFGSSTARSSSGMAAASLRSTSAAEASLDPSPAEGETTGPTTLASATSGTATGMSVAQLEAARAQAEEQLLRLQAQRDRLIRERDQQQQRQRQAASQIIDDGVADVGIPISSNVAILYSSVDGSEEVGEGLGPTIEFYSLVCREVTRKDYKLWIEVDDSASETDTAGSNAASSSASASGVTSSSSSSSASRPAPGPGYVSAVHGLHPLPIIIPPQAPSSAPASSSSSIFPRSIHNGLNVHRAQQVAQHFEFLGRFVGKAMQERRGLDLPLSRSFVNALLAGPSCATASESPTGGSASASAGFQFDVDDVMSFDPSLGRSLTSLQGIVDKRDEELRKVAGILGRFATPSDTTGTAGQSKEDDEAAIASLLSSHEVLVALGQEVECMCLDFSVPGHAQATLTILPLTTASEVGSSAVSTSAAYQALSASQRAAVGHILSLVSTTSAVRPRSWFDAVADSYSAGAGSTTHTFGSDTDVTLSNLHVYIAAVVRTFCVDGVSLQRDSFLRGLAVFLPSACVLRPSSAAGVVACDSILRLFTPRELSDLLCGTSAMTDDTLWSEAAIESAIIIGSHYNVRSPQVKWLVKALSSLAVSDRRLFLKFLTGAGRLPAGGFASLTPARMTVQKALPVSSSSSGARRGGSAAASSSSQAANPADVMLPTASTCHVYLKLPAYSTYEVLLDKLLVAIREGHETFDKT